MRLAAVLIIATAGVAAAQTRDTPFRHDAPVTVAPPANRSPYVGFETREVKTLSADRQEGLRRGAGLGYALAAEINNYPVPSTCSISRSSSNSTRPA